MATGYDWRDYVANEAPRRPKKVPKRSRKYDVPIPKSKRAEVRKAASRNRERKREREEERREDLRQRPKEVMGFGVPDVGFIRAGVGDVAEIASGLIPAAKTVGKSAYSDIRKAQRAIAEGDMPTRKEMGLYYDLLKWTVADEKGDKRKRPETNSEIVGLLAEITRGWGRGIERALPNPGDKEDMAEFRKAWSEDPVFSLLDVLPVGALVTRPLSIAKHTRNIGRANDISRGKALAAGVKESYRPGAAARGKLRERDGEIVREGELKGGIAPRMLRSDVDEVAGRPYSRIPLMRELQRTYDAVYESHSGLARRRVGRAQERFGREEKRRVELEKAELERPIADVMYGRVGKLIGAFGGRAGMTAKERRAATGLTYALQMPEWMSPEDALRAVQDDLSDVLQSGKMEVERGRGRIKQMPLTAEQKANLAVQISDLDLVRRELREGDIGADEWDAGMEALETFAAKNQEMGLDIMRRRYSLDEDEFAELEARYDNRAAMLPRRLAGRGHLKLRDVAEAPERQARLDELTNLLGEDEARAAIAMTDNMARTLWAHDPAGFYEQRVGMPTGEGAEEFMQRIGDEALFQAEDVERRLISGDAAAPDAYTAFYSPLQKYIAEEMPVKMTASQLEGTLKNKIPPEEFENAGLEFFFNELDPQELILKTEFLQHMANPLNAYNLREIVLSNRLDADMDTGTIFDKAYESNYMSREPEPGEYHEVLFQLPGRDKFMDKNRHWERSNIAAHTRFHIFHEDGKLKMLVEEIQSDWANEWRIERAKHKALDELDPEEKADLERMKENLADAERDKTRIQTEMRVLDKKIRDEGGEADELMEYYNLADKLDGLKEYIRDLDGAFNQFGLKGTKPSPLGTGTGAKSSYLNPAIRWLLRHADEQGVDEIHIVGRETQLARNADINPKVFHDLKEDGAEALTQYMKDNPYTRDRSFIGYEEDIPRAFAREMGEKGVKVDDAYGGHYRLANVPDEAADGRMPATVFKMTEGAKQAARKPKSMYQRQPDWKGLPKGATELLKGRTIMHMFGKGDVSTWIHELGHVALHDLDADDLSVIEKQLAGARPLADWADMDHERFARAFEQYVRKGKAPNKELASVFHKISQWMRVIWSEAKGRKVDIPEDVAAVFDKMFSPSPINEIKARGYFPHRDIHKMQQADYRGGVRPPAAGNVIGVPRLTQDALTRKPNEMMLYQGGAVSPDPRALVGVFLNRLRFQVTLDARDELWEMGRPMSERPPADAMLVRNPDALPERISERAQATVRGEDRPRPIDEDLEEKLTIDPEEFRREVIALADENPKWAEDMENVRWVPGDYARTRFGEVFETKPQGKLWSALTMLTSMQRATGIYGRPISYVGGNVPFNVMALMTQMPVSTLRHAGRTMQIRKSNPTLYRAMASEAGETRAGGGLPERNVRGQNRTQRLEQRTTKVQRGLATGLSGLADDPFRVTAFLNNARKKGYSTDKELKHLIEENGTDLHEVRQLVREQMLDFDALNPSQRKIAATALYLWPFMYASVKWPAMFAREYPGRAALGAQAIEGEEERILPQDITNLWKRYGIDLSTINPLGPAGSIAEDADKFLEDPSKMDLTVLKERLSPSLDLLVEGMGGGYKNAFQNFVRGTLPGASEVFSASPEFRGGKIYEDRSAGGYLGQRHVRYWPRGINKEVLRERVEDALKDRISGTTHEKEVDADKKKINGYIKDIGGYSQEDTDLIQTSFKSWWDYQEAVDSKKDSTGQRKLTAVQQVEILDEIIRENYPDIAPDLYPMDVIRNAKDMSTVEDYASELKDIINEGRTMVFDDHSGYGEE